MSFTARVYQLYSNPSRLPLEGSGSIALGSRSASPGLDAQPQANAQMRRGAGIRFPGRFAGAMVANHLATGCHRMQAT